ncbi:MAG: hypothetical protein HQK99_00505 [Nitrospirae bacterium]|nr:hypothetical protein [Nitrospirota bacterium]
MKKSRLRASGSILLSIMALFITMGVVIVVPAYADEEKSAHHEEAAAAPAKEESTAIPPEGTAGPDNATFSLVLSAFNRYMYRGYELSYGSAVFQPSLTFSWMGFSANVWGNIDTYEKPTQSFVPNTPESGSFNEVDLKFSYTRSWGVFSLTGGFIYYGLQYAKQTEEIFVAAGLDIPTKPVLTVYRDIDSYQGTYFNLAFSHSIPVPEVKDMTIDLGACLGYQAGSSNYWRTYETYGYFGAGGYTGRKYSAFHDGMVSLGVTIPIVNNLTIQPIAMYTFPISTDASRMVNGVSYNPNGALDPTFVYGVNLTYNF